MNLLLALIAPALVAMPWVTERELERIAQATTAVLDALLAECAPEGLERIRQGERPSGRGVNRQRRAIARAHAVRVAALREARGEEGIRLARQDLFRVGVELGEEARSRLKVGKTEAELIAAARILYRILGIRLRAEPGTAGRARVEIERCALSQGYSRETCLALSAVDEGFFAGLHPGARLLFVERLTEGRAACLAWLEFPEGVRGGER
jgi:hypothetical protein